MRKILVFVLAVLGSFEIYAQQQIPLNEKHYLDSLQSILRQSRADSSKADASFLLVEYWKMKDTLKSKFYLAAGKKYAKKNPYYTALGYFYEGQYYFSWDHPKASLAFKKSEEALAHFQTKKAYTKRAAAWYNYALMNMDAKGYDYITKITLEKAIPNAEKTGDPKVVAHYYTQLSTILMNNYQFSKATTYSQKAITLLEKGNPGSTELLFAYLSAVSIFCYDHKPEMAKPLLLKAQRLLQPFPESLNNTLYYYNEALFYTTTKQYTKALASINTGIILAKKYNQKQLYQQFFFRRYDVYSEQKDFAKARSILLDIVKEGTLISNINDRAVIYSEIAKTSERLKDYKEAYTWLSKYRDVSDSINNDQTRLKINELETKYRTAQNQQKIVSLQAQNSQALLKSKNERLYNWFLGLGCLFLLGTLAFVLLNARNRRKLLEQKEINYKQQLLELEQKQQLKVTKAMLDGEELERERVARDLHDGLGGMLAGVKIGLSGWSNTNPVVSGDKDLSRIINQLDTSVNELRRIARNMVPETLIKFGLETALKDLCEFHMQESLNINYEAFNIERDIPLNVQLNIYRIVQELLSNAIKHAKAKNILVQCSQNVDTIFITVEDDGIGFDLNLLDQNKGMGLENLKNRIAYLQGKLEILSSENDGTTVNIELNTALNG
ncbi:sensor histidine kinase [Flavobacterium ginsenosidimutans]|uniref:Sensor histidine kinase n=1 Tax=Flavobacterium ginsenosidimutans TaxID=687844 RepID=A0ABZ2Q2Z2_9FLAO